jgi:hypothetical protein
MKTIFTRFFLLTLFAALSGLAKAQQDWPKTISGPDGLTIKMYQPEPESYNANILKFRSAISVVESGSAEPVFGTFWATCKLTPEGNRQAGIESVNITAIKIPSITDQHDLDFIKSTLEYQIPTVATQVSLNDIENALNQNQQESKLSNEISTKAPRVIFATQPSMLIFIDGEPQLKRNEDWGVDIVANSPNVIIRNDDGQYYLYGDHHWFIAPAATGPYQFASMVPSNLLNIESQLNKNSQAQQEEDNDYGEKPEPNIIVSTGPAELIQSNGDPNFTPIEGTNLLYVKNSDNDIFLDVNSQLYYVLISGRWYRSKALGSNQWDFVSSDRLPADFANIPPGSPKDNVLASVAGTDASKDAVMNAQVPQTAKVDRRTARTSVDFNGEPVFEPINGTRLEYAVNTSSTVLRYKGLYYTVDNGVWFVSGSPHGPWAVATERPDDVALIPPSNPTYNSKFVYVYDYDPYYVYDGYTPGYLNSYVYGPTLVYGTGFYYNPWWGGYYYPRPWSWGFNIGYNPWYGWSFGFGVGYGWFNYGFGYPGWYGGWWGPAIYHPYCGWAGGYHPKYYGGYYGGNVNRTNYYSQNNARYSTNNIYNNRTGIASSARSVATLGRASVNGQMTRSSWANRNATRGVQGSNLASRQSNNNMGRAGTLGTSGSRTYNNAFADRQARLSQSQQRTSQSYPLGRSWAPSSDPRANMTRSYSGQSSQSRQAMPQRSGSYGMPQRSFAAPSSPSQRSFSAPSSGGSRAFGGGGRAFSAPSGGSRSFSAPGGGGGSRSFGGGGGRSSGGGGRAGRR